MPPPRDTAPWMAAAGKAFRKDDGQIFAKPDERPDTPGNIRPFRKSRTAQVGKGSIHHGIARDARAPDVRFGRKGEYCMSVGQCLKEAGASGVAAVAAEIAERSYATRQKEPLGKGPAPHSPLPEHTQRAAFAYGVKSKLSEGAKGLIYAAADGKPVAKQVPGVAKQRGYDWAKATIDPTQFRFGRNSLHDAVREGTTKTLVEPDIGRATKLVPIAVAQANAVSGKVLAKPRNMGFGDRVEGVDHVYGSQHRQDEYGARLILASCGEKPQEDDVLGKPVVKSAILRKLREKEAAPDADRVFGVPTLRTDLPKPKDQKTTNVNNYGDDADTQALLYPSAYTAGGVTNGAFQQGMTLDEVKALVERARIDLTDEQTQRAFVRARGGATGSSAVTISAFRKAVDELGY